MGFIRAVARKAVFGKDGANFEPKIRCCRLASLGESENRGCRQNNGGISPPFGANHHPFPRKLARHYIFLRKLPESNAQCHLMGPAKVICSTCRFWLQNNVSMPIPGHGKERQKEHPSDSLWTDDDSAIFRLLPLHYFTARERRHDDSPCGRRWVTVASNRIA